MTEHAGTTAAVTTAATNRVRVRTRGICRQGTDMYDGVSGRQARTSKDCHSQAPTSSPRHVGPTTVAAPEARRTRRAPSTAVATIRPFVRVGGRHLDHPLVLLRDPVFLSPSMSGHSQNSALVGHQRARPRLPGVTLQPLVEAVLVGTRHPLRSQLAPPWGTRTPIPTPPRPAVLIAARVDAHADRKRYIRAAGPPPTTHSRALSASAVGNARHLLQTPGNQRNPENFAACLIHSTSVTIAARSQSRRWLKPTFVLLPDRAGIESLLVIRRDSTEDPHLFVPTSVCLRCPVPAPFRNQPSSHAHGTQSRPLRCRENPSAPRSRCPPQPSCRHRFFAERPGVRGQSHWGTTSDSNSSPVRVVAIEGPAPVQRTRPWFQVSPLQLPEGTQLVPAGRNYAVLPDLPMTRQDDLGAPST